jgi:hypothetical protein
MRRELTMSVFETATLGSVIDALRAAKPEAQVLFDFCGCGPTKVASYRGWYDHLAIGWSDSFDGDWPSAKSVAELLEFADGMAFFGYKGGQYTMNRDTPLWVDRYGDCTGTGIVGVEYLGEHSIILETKKVD